MLAPKIRETYIELVECPTGFDLSNVGDKAAFAEAVITGIQLAIISQAEELYHQSSGNSLNHIIEHQIVLETANITDPAEKTSKAAEIDNRIRKQARRYYGQPYVP